MKPPCSTILLKTTLTHTVTYFLMGLAALFLLGYADKYADPSVAALMRQTTHPPICSPSHRR